MRVWALAALLVAAWMADRACAHGGGGFRGPSGGVPPGLREPPDPPPPPNSAGWKSWRSWWRENRSPILQRKARLLADPTIEFGPGAPPSPIRVRRLERARDRAVLPVLRRVLLAKETPWQVKFAALRSLGRCGGPKDAALLIELVGKAQSGSPELLTALAALARVRTEEPTPLIECAWSILRNRLRSERIRSAAALVLGLQGDRATARELVAFLLAEPLSRDSSRAVLLALGLIGDPVARETLETVAMGLLLGAIRIDESLRACAVRSLGMIGSDRSVPVLVQVLGPMGASEETMSAAALALGEFPRARGVFQILRTCARDSAKRPQLSHCAIVSLGRLKHPEAVKTLLGILDNSKWGADNFAALSLGMRIARAFRCDRVDRGELVVIERAFATARRRVHTSARYFAGILVRNSIEELTRDDLRTQLKNRLPAPTVNALAAPGSVDVRRLLRDPFYERFDYDTFRAPLDAAGYTADPVAIPFLIEVLLDRKRSPEQRAAAADALGRIADVRLMDPFVRLRLRSPFPVGFLGLDQPAWN